MDLKQNATNLNTKISSSQMTLVDNLDKAFQFCKTNQGLLFLHLSKTRVCHHLTMCT